MNMAAKMLLSNGPVHMSSICNACKLAMELVQQGVLHIRALSLGEKVRLKT